MRAKIISNAVIVLFLPFLLNAAKAPDFTVTDFNNVTHHLYADYLNKNKVLVIKLFFVGCPPCATIAPYVQQAYVRWGSGTGKVEFMEISTQSGDYNSLVKAYHQTKGFTFLGIGTDGGSADARMPYTSGNFGSYYGTPTFIVIAPNGDVNFNVPMSTTDQSKLDTAIAQALRLTSGGGGTCTNAFSVKTITQLQPDTYFVEDLLNGNPANEIKDGKYNCEFNLAQNLDGYYVIPQVSSTIDISGVSTIDIVYIQRYLLGLQTFNNLQYAVADVNNSSSVSAADISEIRKLVLGVTSKFNKLTKSFVVVHNPKSTNRNDLTDRVLVKDLVAKTKVSDFGVGKYGDVTGASLFASDEIITRSTDQIHFKVEREQQNDGSYVHRFYTDEDYDLTAFQFELKGISDDIIGIQPSSKFQDPKSFSYNLNLTPGVIRFLGLTQTNEDIHFSAGETWFTIQTRNVDWLTPSHYQDFKFEFIFNQFTNVTNNASVSYLSGALKGESAILTQNSYGEIVIHSNGNIKNVQIINTNGYSLLNQSYPTNISEVRLSENAFQSGIYFAKIQLQNGIVETKKFIKF